MRIDAQVLKGGFNSYVIKLKLFRQYRFKADSGFKEEPHHI